MSANGWIPVWGDLYPEAIVESNVKGSMKTSTFAQFYSNIHVYSQFQVEFSQG